MVFKRRRQASQVEQVIEVHPLITGRMQTAMLKGMVDPTLAAAGGGAWVAGRSGWVPSCRSNRFPMYEAPSPHLNHRAAEGLGREPEPGAQQGDGSPPSQQPDLI